MEWRLQPRQPRCNSHQHLRAYALLRYLHLLQLLNHLERCFRNHYLDHKPTQMSFDWAIAVCLVSPSLERPCHGRPPPVCFHAHRRPAACLPSQTACRRRARNFRATIRIPTSLQRCSCCFLTFLLPFTPLWVTLCRQNLIVKKANFGSNFEKCINQYIFNFLL